MIKLSPTAKSPSIQYLPGGSLIGVAHILDSCIRLRTPNTLKGCFQLLPYVFTDKLNKFVKQTYSKHIN
jgi:hypothetical protein